MYLCLKELCFDLVRCNPLREQLVETAGENSLVLSSVADCHFLPGKAS